MPFVANGIFYDTVSNSIARIEDQVNIENNQRKETHQKGKSLEEIGPEKSR